MAKETDNIFSCNIRWKDDNTTQCVNIKTSTDALKIYSIEVEPEIKPGDVDRDSSITNADVTALVKIVLGDNSSISSGTKKASDVNNDGRVDIADVTALVNILTGKQ